MLPLPTPEKKNKNRLPTYLFFKGDIHLEINEPPPQVNNGVSDTKGDR